MTGEEYQDQKSCQKTAINGNSSVPNRKNFQRIVLILVPRKDYIVEAGTNNGDWESIKYKVTAIIKVSNVYVINLAICSPEIGRAHV